MSMAICELWSASSVGVFRAAAWKGSTIRPHQHRSHLVPRVALRAASLVVVEDKEDPVDREASAAAVQANVPRGAVPFPRGAEVVVAVAHQGRSAKSSRVPGAGRPNRDRPSYSLASAGLD